MNALDLLAQIKEKNLVDLTHDLEDGIPTWPTQPKFEAVTGNRETPRKRRSLSLLKTFRRCQNKSFAASAC